MTMKQNDFAKSLQEKITIDEKNITILSEQKDNIKKLMNYIEGRINLTNEKLNIAKADIGSSVFIDVEINNPELIILNIGYDIYAEVPLVTALGILTKKFHVTTRKITLVQNELSKNIAYLKLTQDLSTQLEKTTVSPSSNNQP